MVFGYVLIWLECFVLCVATIGLFFKLTGSINKAWLRGLAVALLCTLALGVLAYAVYQEHETLRYYTVPFTVVPYFLSMLGAVMVAALIFRKKLGTVPLIFLLPALVIAGGSIFTTAHVMGTGMKTQAASKAAELTARAHANLPGPVPDDENAYVVYQGVINAMSDEESNLLFETYRDRKNLNKQELESFISAHERCLNEIRRASSLSGYDSHFELENLNSLPKFKKHRSMAYLCAAAAERHARNGRFRESILCLQDINILAERMYKHPGTLIHCMIGLAIQNIGKSAMGHCLYSMQNNPSGAGQALNLPAWETTFNGRDFENILDMELAYAAYLHESCCDEKKWEGEAPALKDRIHYYFWKPVYRMIANYQLNAFEARYDDYKRIGRLPCNQIEEAIESYEANRPRDLFNEGSLLIAHVSFLQYRIRNINNVEKTALAVFAYRMEHGQYPQKADDLVPEYLDAIPEDSCSGGPLQLEFVEGGVTIRSLEQGGYDENTIGRGLNTAVEFHMGTAYEKYRLNPQIEDEET